VSVTEKVPLMMMLNAMTLVTVAVNWVGIEITNKKRKKVE